MRHSMNIPNFGDFADARTVAAVAVAAEQGVPRPLSDLVAYIGKHRGSPAATSFEVVVGGVSPAHPAAARDLLGPLADAGATWWDERRPFGDGLDRLAPVLHRLEQGPPAL
ncbi:hypothetical protein AB0I68_21845 [Streptomyces sp. NPDC050448]|uniref:hypothetical protein n=1 Tax=Streptomyces sp. NPDC050448 TaxID=3155404 RepID=UPI00342069DF